MGKRQLHTFNEIQKAIDSKQGIFVMYEPSTTNPNQMDIYFSICKFAPILRPLNIDPDQQFEPSETKFYIYDSFDDMNRDFPNDTHYKMENYSR